MMKEGFMEDEIKKYYQSEKIFSDEKNLNNIIELFECIGRNINKKADDKECILVYSDNDNKINQFIKKTISKNIEDDIFFFKKKIGILKISLNNLVLEELDKSKEEVIFIIAFDDSIDKEFYDNITKQNIIKKNKTIVVFTNSKNKKMFENNPEINFYTIDDFRNKQDELEKRIYNNNSKEKNVLLLAMSKLPLKTNINRYLFKYKDNEGNGIEISGYYKSQMEPVPLMLIEKLNNENTGLDQIFVLDTYETAKDINCKKIFNNNCSFKKKVGIDYIKTYDDEDENKKTNVEKALCEFYDKIQKIINPKEGNRVENHDGCTVNLYVDIHGGLRDTFVIIDAILMLLRDENIKNVVLKDIYTVEYDSDSIIKSCKEQYKVFDFVSGMNEFLNYGRSTNLINYVNKTIRNEDLVKCINDVSNAILLNDIDEFANKLKDLNIEVGDINNSNMADYFHVTEDMISNRYRYKIKEKTYDLLQEENDRNDLIAQLQCYINNKHYQQALLLIEASTQEYLKNNNILKKTNDKKILDNMAIYSTCCLEEIKEDKEIYFYFKEYKRFFNGIRILEDSGNFDDIKNKILAQKNNKCKDEKKYIYPKNNGNINIQYTYDNNQNNKDFEETDIPICDGVKNNMLEEFYIFLYVYKGLKDYRNTVAHPNKSDEERIVENCNDGEKIRDLSAKEVGAWIQFYIELLQILIDCVNAKTNSN